MGQNYGDKLPPTAPWNQPGSAIPLQTGPKLLRRILSIAPWDEQKPPTGQDIFSQQLDNLILPAGVGATVVTTLAGGGAFQLPPANIGVIKSVSWFAGATTGNTNIVFTVRQNRRPIRGLTNLKFPPQNAGSINFALEGTWDLPATAFIDVLVTNRNAFGPWEVNFTMVGWFCPAQDVVRWTGQYPGQITSDDPDDEDR